MDKLFLYYIVIVNIIGFSLMYIDKKRSIKHRWRLKESTLMLISIIGGAIGSFIGMYTFRHKTKHLKFTLGIPIIILIHIGIFIYFVLKGN